MPVKASFSPPVSLINKFTFALRSFTVACRWQRVALRGKLWIGVSGFHGSYSHFHEGHM